MRPTWLFEADVFGRTAEPLKAEIRRQGMVWHVTRQDLLSARRDDAQHTLHETTTRLAHRAVTRLAPSDRVTQRLLRRIIRRFDPRVFGERPQARLDLAQFPTATRCLRAVAHLASR